MDWRKYSLYHVIKKRLDNSFRRDGTIDFLSFISREDNLPSSAFTAVHIVSFIIAYITSASFFQFLILDAVLYYFITAIIAAVDTYYTRKMRIRQEAIASIMLIIEGKRKRKF